LAACAAIVEAAAGEVAADRKADQRRRTAAQDRCCGPGVVGALQEAGNREERGDMIDIKQQELDKAFLDGASAADDAISQALRGELSVEQINRVSQAVYDMLVDRVGMARLEALDFEYRRVLQG
jgi:hypothetical protein